MGKLRVDNPILNALDLVEIMVKGYSERSSQHITVTIAEVNKLAIESGNSIRLVVDEEALKRQQARMMYPAGIKVIETDPKKVGGVPIVDLEKVIVLPRKRNVEKKPYLESEHFGGLQTEPNWTFEEEKEEFLRKKAEEEDAGVTVNEEGEIVWSSKLCKEFAEFERAKERERYT